jgi:hypothetical protein
MTRPSCCVVILPGQDSHTVYLTRSRNLLHFKSASVPSRQRRLFAFLAECNAQRNGSAGKSISDASIITLSAANRTAESNRKDASQPKEDCHHD